MSKAVIHKKFHSRNLHRYGYDFMALIRSYPELRVYVHKNAHGNDSIDFADSKAVKTLNAALLKHHYKINQWDIPEGALCPPIPGRVDYIHYMADLLDLNAGGVSNSQVTNSAISSIRMLDIGIGANGIYSLLASKIYGWECVGSDINTESLENVRQILTHNPDLQERLTLRTQADKHHIFKGIIQPGEMFDLSVCNPPFHASLEDALKGNQRKRANLAKSRGDKAAAGLKSELNFGGAGAELWCKGGEQLFLKKMIKESREFSEQCRWFSSLVSKSENVKIALKLARKQGATDVREIQMHQGNKITRILAWTYI